MVLFLGSGGKSSQVLSTGGLNGGLINRDNSAIRVGNKTTKRSTSNESVSGKVLSTGSLDCGLINWDNSAVGVSNKTAIGGSEGSIASVTSIGGSKVVVGIGISQSVVSIRISVGSKVGSLGSLDFGGLDWGNSSVGVGDKLGAGGSHACEENLKY